MELPDYSALVLSAVVRLEVAVTDDTAEGLVFELSAVAQTPPHHPRGVADCVGVSARPKVFSSVSVALRFRRKIKG